MARFKPGDKKPAASGRKAGTANKATADVRAAMARFAEEGFDAFLAAWQSIKDPGEKCNAYLRALEYHIPKLGRLEHEGGGALKIVLTDPTDRGYLGAGALQACDELIARCLATGADPEATPATGVAQSRGAAESAPRHPPPGTTAPESESEVF